MSRVTVHFPSLHAMQKEIRARPARYKVIAAGRRWGKTRLGLLMCLETALAGGRTWWVGLTYKSLRPAWRDLARIARQIGSARIQESDLLVTFPNGGEVMARTAEDPVNLRGEGLDGVVIDEAAHLKQDVWDGSIRPSLMDRAGWAILISSPAGMNWFHDLWQLGQQDTDWRWASWQRPSTDNTFLADLAAGIEDARRSRHEVRREDRHLREGGVPDGVRGDPGPAPAGEQRPRHPAARRGEPLGVGRQDRR